MSITLSPVAAGARVADHRTARASTGSLRAANHAATDRVLGWLLAAHLPLAFALAPWHDTWPSAIVAGGLATLVPLAATQLAPGRLATRLLVGVAFMAWSALLIHQGGGMIEMHFHVFASLAFLLGYRDWRVPVVAAVAIAVHHAAFNALQAAGAPVTLFAHGHGWSVVAVHAAFVAFETGVLVHLSRLLEAEAAQSEALVALAARLRAGDLAAAPRAGGVLAASGGVVSAAAHALAEGTEGLRTLLVGLRQQSVEVAQLAGTVTAATTQMSAAAGEVSSSLATIAAGAQAQARDTHRLASVVSGGVEGVGTIVARARDVRQSSGHVMAAAEQGAAAVTRTVEGMARIRDAVRESSREIGELAATGEAIAGALQAIGRIAEQTNLLSLNAAIEAARAGAQGKGFGVVAAEVRRLADEAQRSAHEIGALVGRVQAGMRAAVRGMEAEAAQVEEGERLAEAAGVALQQILVAVDRALEDLEGIGGTAERMADAQREALARLVAGDEGAAAGDAGRDDGDVGARALAEVVARSERGAAAAEDASAALEEVSASMQEVQASAAQLAGIAREMDARVGAFRT